MYLGSWIGWHVRSSNFEITMAQWTVFERTNTLHPTELSALYTMLPASLQRRIPRLCSLRRSIISSQELHSSPSTRDSHRGLVSASEPQLECYGSKSELMGDPSRPMTADSQESLASSSSGNPSGISTPEVDRSTAASNYEADSGLRWNRVVPGMPDL